jgi:hypothetical protein
MSRSRFLWFGLGLLLLWGGWKGVAVFGRSAEQQVREAQEALIRTVERRDWSGVAEWLAEDYADDGGHDREGAVADGREALAHFFTLTIKHETTEVVADRAQARAEVRIKLEGTGAGLSQMVLSTVNGMAEPWVFHWSKRGRWPWDWKVERIHHDRLASLPRPDR